MHYAPSVYLPLPRSKFACSRARSRGRWGRVARPKYTFASRLASSFSLPCEFVLKSTPYLEEIQIHTAAQKIVETDVVTRHVGSVNLIQDSEQSFHNYVSLNSVSPQLVRRWCLDHDGVITSLRFRLRFNRTTTQRYNWIILIKYWYQLSPYKYHSHHTNNPLVCYKQ